MIPPRKADSALTQIKRIVEERDKKQAVIVVGFRGIDR